MKTTKRLTVLAIGMAVAALTAALAGIVTPVHSAPMLRQGFTDSPVVSGLTNPTDMEFAPDGRLFVTEDAGRVRIAKPDGTLPTFLNISTKVDSKGERGLLALTFDPGFSTKQSGWGIGLSLARRIVEESHGGTLHLASPDRGASFEIILP